MMNNESPSKPSQQQAKPSSPQSPQQHHNNLKQVNTSAPTSAAPEPPANTAVSPPAPQQASIMPSISIPALSAQSLTQAG